MQPFLLQSNPSSRATPCISSLSLTSMAGNGNGAHEAQLREAGNKLLQPESSAEELISLLDQVASWLSEMKAMSPEQLEARISPLPKALITSELMLNSSNDVIVATASCICEVLRITVPEHPYTDSDMQTKVLDMIVSCLRNLSEASSPSYSKRIRILETSAKIRLGALLLDYEREVLVAEMFDIFVDTIRDDQPENFFSSMETIMIETLELYEVGEDIPCEIIAPLLDVLKRDNEQQVPPLAVELSKNVIKSCADILRPNIIEAMKYTETTLDDYCDFVSAIYEEVPPTSEDGNESPSSSESTNF